MNNPKSAVITAIIAVKRPSDRWNFLSTAARAGNRNRDNPRTIVKTADKKVKAPSQGWGESKCSLPENETMKMASRNPEVIAATPAKPARLCALNHQRLRRRDTAIFIPARMNPKAVNMNPA